MSVLAALLALALIPFAQQDVREDDVIYLDGKKKPKEGQVVYEDDSALVLRTGSREKRYLLADLTEVDSRVRNPDALLDRIEALDDIHTAPVESVLELAALAEDGRLEGESALLYMAVLAQEPENEVALDALGARNKRGGWSIKLGGDWWPTDSLDEGAERWKDRYEFTTAHYVFETNLPLPAATQAALDAERLYRAFFDLFEEALDLRESFELFRVELHADETSFPEASDQRGSQFDANERIVHVRARGSKWRVNLIHELTRQVAYYTTEQTADARGKAPPWLAVGLALAFSSNLGGEPGRTTFDVGSVNREAFRTHANARKPFDLDRVLVFANEDFATTFELQQKFAQCYTLLHFLMFGAGGNHHDGLLKYMRTSWKDGRIAEGDFEDALDEDDKVLQKAWHEYASEMAR